MRNFGTTYPKYKQPKGEGQKVMGVLYSPENEEDFG